MVNKWQEFTLSEIVDLVIDNRGRNPSSYSDTGIPVIDNYLIISEGEPKLSEVKRYISPDLYETFIRKYNQPKDVLLTLVGNGYGKVAISPEEQCIIIQNTIGLRTKEGFDNLFLYYLLRGNRVSLTNLNRGAAQPSIKVGDILSLKFNFPSFKHQKSIGNTLYVLDQKIKHNTQTNQTLEQMAQALFKSWFVDFDPVFDNALASGMAVNDFPEALQKKALFRQQQRQQVQQQIANGEHGTKPLPKDIRQLFPSEFEQTDEPSIGINGWIPIGWKLAISGKEIDVRDGTHDSPKKSDLGYPLITSKHITDGSLKIEDAYLISEEDYKKVNARSRVESGDILITMIGTVGVPYLVIQQNVDFAIKNIGLLRTSEKETLKHYFYQLLKSQSMQNHIDSLLAGTTQKYISLKALRSIQFLLPDETVLLEFNKTLNTFSAKLLSNNNSIKSLEKLRDTLLPKLISGELTINKDAAQ